MNDTTFIARLKSGLWPFVYRVGLITLLMFAFNLLFVTTCFFVGVTVGPAALIVPFVLAVGAVWLMGARDGGAWNLRLHWESVAAAAVACIALLVAACLLEGGVFSPDYDGNTYHKMAIGLMKNGWNPIFESSQDAADRFFRGDQWQVMYGTSSGGADPKAGTIDSFAKATWCFASAVYSVFGNIEAGKSYNILGCVAVFCIALPYLREKLPGRKGAPLFVAVLLAFGPVPITQMFEYYVDGFLASMMFCLVIGLTQMLDEKSRFHGRWAWATIFAAMIELGNIKFTGLAYGGMLCILFFIMSAVVRFRRDGKQAMKPVLGCFGVFLALAVASACWAGAPTYVTNTIRHANPLYPLQWSINFNVLELGADLSDKVRSILIHEDDGLSPEDRAEIEAKSEERKRHYEEMMETSASVSTVPQEMPEKVDTSSALNIMGGNTPAGYFGKPTWYTNFYSLFGEMSNINNADTPDIPLPNLKVPFTVTENEWALVRGISYDTRIGGFGPLFGGVLILTVIAFVADILLLWRRQRGLALYAIVLTGFILLMILAVSESWWARYSPHFYLIPVLTIFMMFKCRDAGEPDETGRPSVGRSLYSLIGGGLLSVLLLLNNAIFLLGVQTQFERSVEIRETLEGLSGEEIQLYNFHLSNDFLLFSGITFDLEDFGIDWTIVPKEEVESGNRTFFGRLPYGIPPIQLD